MVVNSREGWGRGMRQNHTKHAVNKQVRVNSEDVLNSAISQTEQTTSILYSTFYLAPYQTL